VPAGSAKGRHAPSGLTGVARIAGAMPVDVSLWRGRVAILIDP